MRSSLQSTSTVQSSVLSLPAATSQASTPTLAPSPFCFIATAPTPALTSLAGIQKIPMHLCFPRKGNDRFIFFICLNQWTLCGDRYEIWGRRWLRRDFPQPPQVPRRARQPWDPPYERRSLPSKGQSAVYERRRHRPLRQRLQRRGKIKDLFLILQSDYLFIVLRILWIFYQETVYCENPEEREDAGTPPIVQKLRAALAFAVKSYVGDTVIRRREGEVAQRVMVRLSGNKKIRVLGEEKGERQPVFSFVVFPGGSDSEGKYLHCHLTSRLLNDLFGIQARGGCACAGPYGHLLLGISREQSLQYRDVINKVRLLLPLLQKSTKMLATWMSFNLVRFELSP